MLQVVSFTFNPFYENTYLVINEQKQAIIVDPGMYNGTELMEFHTYIEQHNITPVFIYNTHAHIDHILSVDVIKQHYNIPFGLHTKEIPVLENANLAAQLYNLKLSAVPKVDHFINEGDLLFLGNSALRVLFTPGHSPGSISFYAPDEAFVISGDVLFQNGIGRTDLPGGNQEQLFESINSQLFTLPDNTEVYPGHGPVTMIQIEKNFGYLSKCI